MFCYKCGAENDDNSQYCWKCGTLIKKEQEVKIQDTVEKNNKSIKSFVIVFFILLLVTCSVLFLINNNRKQLYVFTVKDEQGNILCLVYNKNTQNCRGDSPKLQREIPQ